MSFDNSRFTFDHFKDYAGVVSGQGRVQSDADWNEWLAENSRRTQAGTLDMMGHAAYPPTTPCAFQITAGYAAGKNTISIGLGRMYLDGLLAENHGPIGSAVWDPALAELSGSPQPPPASAQAGSIDFGSQPYSPNSIVPQGGGTYLVYLDVWKRPVTYIEDPNLVDVAIGIDTTGRVQTAWRVGLIPLPGSGFSVAGSVTSGTFIPNEQVVQATSRASAYLVGSVPGAEPMFVGPITGTADATDIWTGQTSQAVFTPSAAPVVFDPSSTVTGSVTSGVFLSNEQVVQTNTGASANLIGMVTGNNSMIIGPITGAADATDTWVGKISQAVFTPTATPVVAVWNCQTPDSAVPWPATSGRLTTGTVQSGPSGPCCLTTGTGYTGVENQFYRVEIHNPGGPGGAGATFKWSRENASVQTNVTQIAGGTNSLNQLASVLTVQSLGRDQVLGFSNGNWIEISNQTFDDNCLPGELYKIDSVDLSTMSITLTTQLSANFPNGATPSGSNQYTRICRWDQAGKIVQGDNTAYYDLDAAGAGGLPDGMGGIPVPPPGTVLLLENGITVQFELSSPTGNYLAMDYWTFAARTADGLLHPPLTAAPPRGLYHHYTKLSVVTLGSSPGATDCRLPWAPAESGGCGCCTCTVGPNAQYNTIQAAINALPAQGGEVCILPGCYYENVLIQGLHNVVISGCGWQTHIYSLALQPGSNIAPGNAPPPSETGWSAVFTAIGCTHLEFRSFSVHAARGQVGILLDRGLIKPPQNAPLDNAQPGEVGSETFGADADVIIEDLQVTAFNLPAIAALGVKGLRIMENRIAMGRIESRSPAVYLSGEDLFFERNWVGLAPVEKPSSGEASNQAGAKATESGVDTDEAETNEDFRLNAAGGIQIGGPSNEVFVLENEIVGGYSNGITLGNILLLEANGTPGVNPLPVWNEPHDPCATEGSLSLSETTTGDNPVRIVAGDVIKNLHIDRNRIHDMGLCGIGPVGFFDLTKTVEVISLENVTISANIISNTLKWPLEVTTNYGGGAICLPDVRNLIIRDNLITDFGAVPGAEVCGIFVLLAETTEISRNQIKETRDLSASTSNSVDAFGGIRAGILVLLVMPPSQTPLAQASAALNGTLVFAPGLPALRIQENVVRVAIGLALEVVGFGPFEITGNHFGSGGTVQFSGTISLQDAGAIAGETGTIAGALTVAVLNLGLAIEIADIFFGFAEVYAAHLNTTIAPGLASAAYSSNGAVLFTNNICQLQAVISDVVGFGSVFIASLDHVLFANNQLWLNGQIGVSGTKVGDFNAGLPPSGAASPGTAVLDAFIFGITVQVCTNRFQESFNFPVWCSGLTLGISNITSQNISTYLLLSEPSVAPFNSQNLPAF